MRLLCAADIHLGRQPSRLPEALAARAGELGPTAAWRRLVQLAVDERVDALLLAGDVVDQDNDFFEAFADLRDGVARLHGANIPVLAVAGNHDVRVLPRLADAVEGFTLLGRDGRWQERLVPGADGARVRVLGWSFPRADVPGNPLATALPARSGDITVGLLHCDRGQASSRYAPVPAADLEAAPVDAWLLGHVHKPDIASGAQPSGYLGSLVGTDPGESGPHGAWLLEVAPGGALELQSVPLAPLRWETLEVSLNGLRDPVDATGRIVAEIDALHERLQPTEPQPAAVGCRLRLTGRTALRRAVSRTLAGADPRTTYPRAGISYFVHAYRLEALPELDLASLADGADPAGLLARKLLLLRDRANQQQRLALIRRARERLASLPERRRALAGVAEPPDDERVADLLEEAALTALDALLEQQEQAP